jgi:DNA polymerase/3'-5' exonuclease PolX
VGDVELVLEPRRVASIFGPGDPDTASVRLVAEKWGRIIKGGQRMIQVERPDGVRVDLYLVHPPAEWACILAIRTGPSELGHLAVTRLTARGYRHVDGRILRGQNGPAVPVPDEETFFGLAGLEYFPPEQRNGPSARRPSAARSP